MHVRASIRTRVRSNLTTVVSKGCLQFNILHEYLEFEELSLRLYYFVFVLLFFT